VNNLLLTSCGHDGKI